MKQVTQRLKNGRIEVLDVPSPAVAAEGVLIAVRTSWLSPGTESSTVKGGPGESDRQGARQVIEMRAEVAVGRAGQALEPREVEALFARIACGQRRHDAQADRLMDDFVRPVHRFRPAASRGRRV